MVSVVPTTVPVHQQWLFTPDKLLQTASAADGISLNEELEARRTGCLHLSRLATTLPRGGPDYKYHYVFATAACYLQRFYMRKSIRDYPPTDIAAVALFLAGKECEASTRLSRLAAHVLHRKRKEELRRQGREGQILLEVNQNDPELTPLRERMLSQEEVLASTLLWEFIPALPYQPFSLGVTRILSQDLEMRRSEIQHFIQAGWCFINDSCITPLCVLQPPSIIASAAYILATLALAVDDRTSLEELLDSFHTWKGHFGLEEDDEHDRDDVEESILWMIFSNRERLMKFKRSQSLQALQHRRPKPLPPPSFSASMAPVPSPLPSANYTPLASPLPPNHSPYHPSSQPSQSAPPPRSTAGINPYETQLGGMDVDMDMESSPAVGSGH
ncbi:cyclin-like protein [Mrakia frigida]|uniref:cyclin-like protein n=1 Tax=Mrakia frigida TaxID=29902 RepID=UPI003FCC06C4